MKSFSSKRARLSAALTGKGRERGIGPVEAHEKNVLAITRRIHTMTAKRATLTKQLRALAVDLRTARRELRLVLQRDSTMTIENADDRLDAAGKSDAIDASQAHAERLVKNG